MSSSYILDINLLLFISLENIFSHSVDCLFILPMVSFAVQKLWSLIQPHLFIFAFISFTGEDTSKKIYFHSPCQRVFLPMFSLRSFMFSGLTFRYFKSALSSFLYMVWGNIPISLFYMELSSFPSTTYWRYCVFPIVHSCHLCHSLIDHRYMCLFLGPLFFSIGLCLFWGQHHAVLITVALWGSLKSGSLILLALFSFSRKTSVRRQQWSRGRISSLRGVCEIHCD